jgi:predicted hydrocarbon binding protein
VRLRKDVNVYLFDPTRKYFHIVVELENVPGALQSVMEVMHGLNLNILGSFTSADSAASLGVWSGFVEDSDHSALDLRRKLGASPAVHDAMVVESNNGFLVDSVHFPVAFNTGTRAIMMGAGALANMLSTMNERFGTGGNVILHEEGKTYGRELGQEYLLRLGADFIMANLEEVVKLYQALGWFRVESAKADPRWEKVAVRAAESFECAGAESKVPRSHFVRGHLEGMLTIWLGKPMECKETLCVARGDTVCEFSLTPRAP